MEGITCVEYIKMNQRQLRLRALVQAPRKKDYPEKIYDLEKFSTAPQIQSEYSFEGNWWYFWFRGDMPINEGDNISLDQNYIVDQIHVYKNYKRGTMLLS